MINLNLYVGPLCRYYTGKWETVAQRYARKHNLTTLSAIADDAVALTRLKPESRSSSYPCMAIEIKCTICRCMVRTA